LNYNDLTRRHFETAVRAGVLSGPGVLRGAAGSVRLGTWVQFDVQLERNRAPHHALANPPATIRAVRFLAFGCPHVIAAADWIAGQAVGSPATAALPEDVTALRERFAVPIEKLGRLLVVEDAWIAALATPHEPNDMRI
jgi:NifU-like protein involved in Fe-S cluster formation